MFLRQKQGNKRKIACFLFLFVMSVNKINSLPKSIFRFLAQNTGLYLRAAD